MKKVLSHIWVENYNYEMQDDFSKYAIPLRFCYIIQVIFNRILKSFIHAIVSFYFTVVITNF